MRTDELRQIVSDFLEWHEGNPCPPMLIERARIAVLTDEEKADCGLLSELDEGADGGSEQKLPRHKFWGAGEPDCPPELKASNGELHTMRCKVCGDGWRKSTDVCLAARGAKPCPLCDAPPGHEHSSSCPRSPLDPMQVRRPKHP